LELLPLRPPLRLLRWQASVSTSSVFESNALYQIDLSLNQHPVVGLFSDRIELFASLLQPFGIHIASIAHPLGVKALRFYLGESDYTFSVRKGQIDLCAKAGDLLQASFG
jgi:hypothetical protein